MESKFRPIERDWLMYQYWILEKTSPEIAELCDANDNWVRKEIRRHGLQKSQNSVKRKGKKGYKMPLLERLKHHKQPHAKRVYRLDAETKSVKEVYESMAAAVRDGYRADRIRAVIKTGNAHRGYCWRR